jgi:hypothetical protein
MRNRNTRDSFSNFLLKTGKFTASLNHKEAPYYCGDHLYLQKDYFFLDGKKINYNCEIDFKQIENGFARVKKALSLPDSFFRKKLNPAPATKKEHYSYFFNNRRRRLVERLYREDIEFFGFEFQEEKNLFQKLWKNIKY